MSDASRARYSVRKSTRPIWAWLILAGIALYTLFSVLLDHAMRGDPDNPVISDLLDVQLPRWGQNLGHAAMVMILVGGFMCAIAPAAVRLGRHYQLLLWASFVYSLVLVARNLQPRDFLTSAVYSSLAPGCALASCLLFASADRNGWRALIRIVAFGSVVVALIALFEMTQMRSSSRAEAFWRLDTYAKILEVTAIVGFGWFAKARKAWIGAIPLAVLIAATVAMQTRLMVVELVSLFGFYRLFSQRKISTPAVIAMYLAGIMVLGAFYLDVYSPTTLRSIVPASAASFWDRSTEDTRSGQLVDFFRKVPPSTFLLGIGIPRQGEYNGQGSEGIDLGYVNILYLGGVPALILFFVIHLLPVVRCIGCKFDAVDAACLASVMTYGVRLFSSTVPGFSPAYFILLLLIGRCAILQRESKDRRRIARPWRSPMKISEQAGTL